MKEGLTHAQIWGGGITPRRGPGWLRSIWPALAASAVNFLAWPFAGHVLASSTVTIGFNVTRLVIMLWAGYLATRVGACGFWAAALAGVAVMVVDHVVLKGGWFLASHLRGAQFEALGEDAFLMAFFGVLVSFVLLSPVAALAGFMGRILARMRGGAIAH